MQGCAPARVWYALRPGMLADARCPRSLASAVVWGTGPAMRPSGPSAIGFLTTGPSAGTFRNWTLRGSPGIALRADPPLDPSFMRRPPRQRWWSDLSENGHGVPRVGAGAPPRRRWCRRRSFPGGHPCEPEAERGSPGPARALPSRRVGGIHVRRRRSLCEHDRSARAPLTPVSSNQRLPCPSDFPRFHPSSPRRGGHMVGYRPSAMLQSQKTRAREARRGQRSHRDRP